MLLASANWRLNDDAGKHAPWVQLRPEDFTVISLSNDYAETDVGLTLRQETTDIWPVLSPPTSGS